MLSFLSCFSPATNGYKLSEQLLSTTQRHLLRQQVDAFLGASITVSATFGHSA
jgi:hypothetical protein